MDNGESSYRRFLAGDNEGLREIICSYRAGLILYLNSFVQNVHTSEELTEDVFLELIIKRPKFSGKCSFKTWLYAIGRNLTAKHLAETDSIAAYLKKRMGRSSDKVITVSDKTVSLLFHENGQCYANAFVDENHYFDVIGAVSEEEMTEFLNAFTYEKTVF